MNFGSLLERGRLIDVPSSRRRCVADSRPLLGRRRDKVVWYHSGILERDHVKQDLRIRPNDLLISAACAKVEIPTGRDQSVQMYATTCSKEDRPDYHQQLQDEDDFL